jgi:putative copper export protein
LRIVHGRGLSIQLASELPAGAYRVDGHTVSTEDGHALEGSFGFGVRAEAVGGAKSVQQSPLARDGWLRILSRTLFYAALVFFAGGLLNGSLLARERPPADWLLPRSEQRADGGWEPAVMRTRLWGRTLDAGWLAVGAAATTVAAEAFDAGSGLQPDALVQFLLSNVAGVARVVMVLTLLASVALANRRPTLAAVGLAISLLSISASGHANSAQPRELAILGDWLHLLAGTLWLGGIAQIALAWWRLRASAPRELRAAVMRDVLGTFGRLALPAFLVVVATGLLGALIQLGRPQAAWETPYGRVLVVKSVLVALIGMASYLHAMRLRPRLLRAAEPAAPGRLERRHWSLLRSEPLVGMAVMAAAAVLVTFPLPPRQLGEANEARRPPRRSRRAHPARSERRSQASLPSPSRPGRGSSRRGYAACRPGSAARSGSWDAPRHRWQPKPASRAPSSGPAASAAGASASTADRGA